MIGVLISIPVLAIVVALLYQADAVFANLFGSLFSIDFHFGTWVGMVFMFGYALLAAYCGIRFLASEKISAESKDMRHFEPMIANTILVLISIVYAAFSFIQIFFALSWKDATAGWIYVRKICQRGLFPAFVCMYDQCRTGAVVHGVISGKSFQKDSAHCNLWMHVYYDCIIRIPDVFVHSALQSYFLRLFVLWMLAVIGILLTGILVQIYVNKFPMFRYTIVVVTVCVFALGVAHPDYWIAKYDVAHMNHMRKENAIDYNYLQTLSTDAAPVIATQNGEWAEKYGKYVVQTLEEEKRRIARIQFLTCKGESFVYRTENEVK